MADDSSTIATLTASRDQAIAGQRAAIDAAKDAVAAMDAALAELAALHARLLPAALLDPESAAVLARAHGVAQQLLDGVADSGPLEIDALDQSTIVAYGYALVVGRLHEYNAVSPTLSRCGWCHAAAGGTDEAWLALPSLATADIQAHTLTCEHNPLVRELAELRAVRAADAARIKAVVALAVNAELIERKLYLVKPQRPTMGEIALEHYGHGRACDAVALLDADLQAQIDAIAARAAEQLATAAEPEWQRRVHAQVDAEDAASATPHPAELPNNDARTLEWVRRHALRGYRSDVEGRDMFDGEALARAESLLDRLITARRSTP